MRRWFVVVYAAGALLTPGCRWWAKKPPPPPAPAPLPPPAAKKPSKPPVLEAPSAEVAKPAAKVPDVRKPPVVVETRPEEVPPPPEPPKPESKKPARTVRRPASKQPATTPATTPSVPAPQAGPVENTPGTPSPEPAPATESPKLGEVLSPQQRSQVQMAFEVSRSEARKALAQVETHQLNREQSETAARARNFLAQADRLQETDLRTAAQLARRAQLLAQDLLKEFN